MIRSVDEFVSFEEGRMEIKKHISLHHKGKKGNIGMKYNKRDKQ